jgi:hypothetical protein
MGPQPSQAAMAAAFPQAPPHTGAVTGLLELSPSPAGAFAQPQVFVRGAGGLQA